MFSLQLLLSILISFGQTQDWDCSHYDFYTVGVCYQYSGSLQRYFECNGTNTIAQMDFTDGSCGTSDATPDTSFSYMYTTEDSSLSVFNCGSSLACSYLILRYFYDDYCRGESYFDSPIITNQRYRCSFQGSSSMYSCSGNTYTCDYYTSHDCSGTPTSTSTTINDECNDDIDGSGCYTVC